ncbi:META domain-containing protein [Sphingorhabdus pulchriflava]|uniref:META domain-containing protein n=2 Tax=Sphingorhabdus pulchriflava TaxID=2292257 RepID=A0A371BI72_9SPHN|nr:META domain-containing protein [Sphingorhabdus pulchriflava]
MRNLIPLAGVAIACAIATPVNASTSKSWMQVDKASRAACLKAASLNDAVTGPPIRYSDRLLIDARVVTGTWPQPHMKGAKAKMLCLYHRRSKRVEVQELAYPIPPAPQAMIKDVWWQAYSIDGKPVVSGSEVTLMLGSDGKVGGKSGCNGYGASYQLDGSSLKVFPPMIGTMMACAPNLMDQEQAYRALMEKATIASLTTDGKLEVVSASGATIRFTKK